MIAGLLMEVCVSIIILAIGMSCRDRCENPGNDPNSNEIQSGCAPAGSVGNYVKCPENGEWQYVGEGDWCTYDSQKPGCFLDCDGAMSCGVGNMTGHCKVAGKRGRCQRKSGSDGYQADKVQCCLGNALTVGDKTCHPDYRNKNGPACQSALREHCSQGKNLFSAECQAWASGTGDGNPEADTVITSVCLRPENKSKRECQCIISGKKLADLGVNPSKIPVKCIDAKCQDPRALQTTAMRRTVCNVTNCSIQDLKILQNYSKINGGININQKCSSESISSFKANTSGSGQTRLDDMTSSAGPAGSQNIDEEPSSNTGLIIGLVGGALALTCLVGVGIYVSKKSRRPRYPMGPAPYGMPMGQPMQPMGQPMQPPGMTMAPPMGYPNPNMGYRM